MNNDVSQKYISILRHELIPALGCTEPIAIAYASAKAREVLGEMPESIEIRCSGNIVKNVKGVTVPNSGGMIGIKVAATLGVVGGNAGGELEVLSNINDEHRATTRDLLKNKYCKYSLEENVDNLYIEARVKAGQHRAMVVIENHHTNIARIEKDGKILLEPTPVRQSGKYCELYDRSILNFRDIYDFSNDVDIDEVRDVISAQIKMNTEISKVGLENAYGAQVGRTISECYADNVKTKAIARAAAGSDARMGGCALPVVINSGSGNQGITISLPIIQYAETLKTGEDKLYRALVLANLIAVHIKKNIGDLSAFCGVVSAAAAAGAGITYLYDGSYQQICDTITNTLANTSGIVCDGAKASCAAKIATALNAAILGHEMSMKVRVFQNGQGLVQKDVEDTVRSISYLGRVGMRSTDQEILHLMTGKAKFK